MIGFFYKNGMDKTQRFRMTPSTNNTLENLVNTLSDQQMTRTEDIICATISSHYHENARIKVIDFLRDSSKRMVTYGYSSGGSRAHMLYRSENGKLFIVFKTAQRGERVYYLRKNLLYDVFEDHENEIPDFDEHTAEEGFISPPMMIGRSYSCT